MNSMTGYAFKEAVVSGTQVSVEIKSVNSRFLDLSVSIPPFLGPLERRIRQTVASRVVRGKVDVAVRVRDESSSATVTVDAAAAAAYRDALLKVAEAVGQSLSPSDIPVALIAQQEGVLVVSHDYDAEAYWEKISGVFCEVLEQFSQDRAREGSALKADLLEKLSVLDGCAAFFCEWQPKMEQKFRESIQRRFAELLGDSVDENRVMQETAAMLVKYTINEEVVRLRSHLCAMRAELEKNPAPGKRLDFICQEANREINTIGSKNQFPEVGAMVITAKDALENIREQGKNVE